MEIQWFGQNSFKLSGENGAILIDPTTQDNIGNDAKIVIFTDKETAEANKLDLMTAKVFDWPGEYEAAGMAVSLTALDKLGGDQLLAHIVIDGFRVVNLGKLNQELSNEQASELGTVDILMVPVGGNYVLDPKKAADTIEKIEPKLVIPALHQTDTDADLLPLSEFSKVTGINMEREEKKLKLKDTSQLNSERTEFVSLEKL